MLNPDEFYGAKNIPGKFIRRKIWKAIKRSMSEEKNPFAPRIEFRSFAFGAASVFIIIFFAVGVYSTYKSISENNSPQYVKINNAYQNAIESFEATLPVVASGNNSVKIDDYINSKKDELKFIDGAISDVENHGFDYSKIKQSRLRELYRMKLKALDEIILIEGGEL